MAKSQSPLASSSRAKENNRRSFTGPYSRPNVMTASRRFEPPSTPANSPYDFGRNYDEKENDVMMKDNGLFLRCSSPAKNGNKNFMSPTISAASKFTPSPRKRALLAERTDPIRSSMFLSDGKAMFFSANVSQDAKSENGSSLVSSPIAAAAACDEEEEEEVDVCHSKSSTKKVTFSDLAPLDADPSLPPYDPKTNYLSPRPQFLHYKPPDPSLGILESDDCVSGETFSDSQVTEAEEESPTTNTTHDDDDMSVVTGADEVTSEADSENKTRGEEEVETKPWGLSKSLRFVTLLLLLTFFAAAAFTTFYSPEEGSLTFVDHPPYDELLLPINISELQTNQLWGDYQEWDDFALETALHIPHHHHHPVVVGLLPDHQEWDLEPPIPVVDHPHESATTTTNVVVDHQEWYSGVEVEEFEHNVAQPELVLETTTLVVPLENEAVILDHDDETKQAVEKESQIAAIPVSSDEMNQSQDNYSAAAAAAALMAAIVVALFVVIQYKRVPSTAQVQKRSKKKTSSFRLSTNTSSPPPPSYGSYTTFEKIPIKNGRSGEEEEVVTPVRRSSRIRNHQMSSTSSPLMMHAAFTDVIMRSSPYAIGNGSSFMANILPNTNPKASATPNSVCNRTQ
ncbi:hypothetical protein M569_09953 [Genlisea aurea]|uniref:Uncharacterized protein n=1 Tax=Genlisea aurea TaxID=192259 RepID=S8CDA7_9LAMI|nr:hypothetical protein M569_09953 [Genlisea aurea]